MAVGTCFGIILPFACALLFVCVFVCVQLWSLIDDMVSNSTNIKGKDLEKYIMMAKMHNLTSLPTNLQK